jgi:hypothetical protein
MSIDANSRPAAPSVVEGAEVFSKKLAFACSRLLGESVEAAG